jgi:23S rRNA pseudouridine1911/1915/1917 synthase
LFSRGERPGPVPRGLGLGSRLNYLLMFPLEILFEDNHCLAIAKPNGRLTTHYAGGEETLDRAVKEYLKEKYGKPGNVYLGIVHRLDRPVSGVLLFARTSKAAARLAEQFRTGKVEKIYWAVVEGDVTPAAGDLENWLRKDHLRSQVEVVEAEAPGSRKASLHFERKSSHEGLTWLEIRPRTGRTHQLRVQLAHIGHPIYGDTKYGSQHPFETAIALHARALTFWHPIHWEPVTLTAPLPPLWRGRFPQLLSEVTP